MTDQHDAADHRHTARPGAPLEGAGQGDAPQRPPHGESPPLSDDELSARFMAAKGFLVAEWVGALLCVASFTQLYIAGATRILSPAASLTIGLALLFVGTFMWARSRTLYLRMDFPWRRRLEHAATVVAGAGWIFWLLFALLYLLVLRGIEIL